MISIGLIIKNIVALSKSDNMNYMHTAPPG